jgi:hypothetical protein
MWWSRVSGLARFLTADQKQQSVNVCVELRQIVFDKATLLCMVITVTGAGFMVMTLRQSNNAPNGKSKAKPRACSSFSLISRGLFAKN